jgi:hypothetical protein
MFRFLNPSNPTHSLTLSFTERKFAITLLRTQRDTNLRVPFRYSEQKLAMSKTYSVYIFIYIQSINTTTSDKSNM